MQTGMSMEASKTYKVLQNIESSILLQDLIEERDQYKYAGHFRRWEHFEYPGPVFATIWSRPYRFASSIAVFVGYGRRIKELDDPVLVAQREVEECKSMDGFHFLS